MKTKYYPLILIIFITLTSLKGDKPAYNLFNINGKPVKYQTLLNDALKADVVLFGELHNNPVCHWLQYELTKDLHASVGENLILAAEMFEADNQLQLDEYTAGAIRQRNFEDDTRLWKNYTTDYKPLMEFARDNNLKFIASNIPRRYASIVHQKGFEALEELSDEAKKFIAPLPIDYNPELPGYKGMLEMTGGMGSPHANDNLPKAQAVKDATMAYFILKYLQQGTIIIHYNGTYHSNNFEGIYWYLKKHNPDLNILTIASVEQDSISKLTPENKNLADYTICITTSMTKTY